MNRFDEELQGERAPEYLQSFVARCGGKTPVGVPRYRLVWAPSVKVKSHDTFYDWDDSFEPSERGGLVMNPDGSWAQTTNHPLKVVKETRWIDVYPFDEGWILERWYPASMFGDPVTWAKHPTLGPFPESGRYVDCCNPMTIFPAIPKLEKLIQAIEYKIANKEGTMQERLRKNIEKRMEAKRRRKQASRELAKAMMHDRTTMLFSSSLEAGRYREEIANRYRARGIHIGHVGN